jgi:hypothetical protein
VARTRTTRTRTRRVLLRPASRITAIRSGSNSALVESPGSNIRGFFNSDFLHSSKSRACRGVRKADTAWTTTILGWRSRRPRRIGAELRADLSATPPRYRCVVHRTAV